MSRVGLVFLSLACLFAGCNAAPPPAAKRLVLAEGQALLTTYLSTSGSALDSASFVIERVALHQDDVWLELDLPAVQVDNRDRRNRQLLLGVAPAPAGEHRRLRFVLTNLKVNGRTVLPEGQGQMVEVRLPEPLSLESRDSKCLFVDWSLEAIGSNAEVAPAFSARGQRIQLGTGLVYIACRDIDTVYVLRSDNDEIVASFAVPGPLGELQVDQRRRRLYILSPKTRSIYVYDSLKARVVEQIFLPGTVAPEHFVADANRQFAYVTDSASGLVLKINLLGGTVQARRSIGRRPGAISLVEDTSARLAVLTPKAQQVSILNADNLAVQRVFPVGQQVVDLLYSAGLLFVVEQASDTVATYQDQTGKLLARIPVGRDPQELLAVDNGLLYVSNQRSNSLSAIIPGQEISFRRIPAGPAPQLLGLSRRHQVLYVLSGPKRTLSVVDLRGEFMRRTVRIGGSPSDVAVLD